MAKKLGPGMSRGKQPRMPYQKDTSRSARKLVQGGKYVDNITSASIRKIITRFGITHDSLANIFGGAPGDYFHLLEASYDQLLLDLAAVIVTQADGADALPLSLGTKAIGVATKFMRQDAVISDILPATTTMLDGAAAITQAVDDDTTKVATDEFVLNQASDADPTTLAAAAAAGVSNRYSRADHAHIETATTQVATNSSSSIATTQHVTDKIADLNLYQFKGTITVPNPYPAGDAGDIYIVTGADGVIGGTGPTLESGDTLLCIVDGSAGGTHAAVGSEWIVGQANLQPELYALLSGATFTGPVNIFEDFKIKDTSAAKIARFSMGTTAEDGSGSITYEEATGEIAIGSGRAANNLVLRTTNTGKIIVRGGPLTFEDTSLDMASATNVSNYFRPPSLTSIERDALTPANGWVIFNETDQTLQQYANGVWGSIGGGDALVVTKAGHGWLDADVGSKVYKGTGAGVYTLADASSEEAAESFWYISKWISSSQFELKAGGVLTRTTGELDAILGSSSGPAEKAIYYLAANGATYPLTTSTPADGEFNKPVCIALSTTELWYFDYRGVEYVDTYGDPFTVTWAQALGTTLDVPHNMDMLNLHITGRDSDGYEVSVYNRPKDGTNRDIITLDFTGYVEADFPMIFALNGTGASNTLDMDNITVPSAPSGAGAAGSSSLAMPIDAVLPVAPTMFFKDVKSNGSAGGGITADTWTARVLQTTEGSIVGASLASSNITLAAGTYIVDISCPAYNVNSHKAKLYNLTDAADELVGTGEYASNSSDSANCSFIKGIITIAAEKVFEIRHRSSATQATNGLGVNNSFGEVEVYTVAKIQKIA